MIAEQSLRRFLDELASSAPTPGGGSAAAVMGAMGAALVSMVCNLTIGKKNYDGVEADMCQALGEAEALRQRLNGMIAADAQAFDALMAAYKLPRTSDEDKMARDRVIQDALKQATDVPLACAEACARVIELARRVAAYAALRSAALNVYINAPSIKDAEFARSRRERLDQMLARCATASEQAYNTVLTRLG